VDELQLLEVEARVERVADGGTRLQYKVSAGIPNRGSLIFQCNSVGMKYLHVGGEEDAGQHHGEDEHHVEQPHRACEV
jgi:hypothetical protein